MTELLKGSKLGKKNGPFEWTTEADQAFSMLRAGFTQAPILSHFDPTCKLRLETDASAFALAAIVSQLKSINGSNPEWHLIAFFSRKFTDTKRNYETYD
jgi:hypothetical protein